MPTLKGLRITPLHSLVPSTGGTVTFTVYAVYSNGFEEDVTSLCSWYLVTDIVRWIQVEAPVSIIGVYDTDFGWSNGVTWPYLIEADYQGHSAVSGVTRVSKLVGSGTGTRFAPKPCSANWNYAWSGYATVCYRENGTQLFQNPHSHEYVTFWQLGQVSTLELGAYIGTVSPTGGEVAWVRGSSWTATEVTGDNTFTRSINITGWQSTNDNVASVLGGDITATGSGSCRVSALVQVVDTSQHLSDPPVVTTYPEQELFMVDVTVILPPPPILQSVEISGLINLNLKEITEYTATGHYDDGSTADITNLVSWSSSDV